MNGKQALTISERLAAIRAEIPEGIQIVAVSKFHPAQAIRDAYEAGQRLFGESRVQELLEKMAVLPSDIRWHFIGHLQTNKVRQLAGKAVMVESVDSVRLLELIGAESARVGAVTEVLLQVHVAEEDTKFGFTPVELLDYMHTGKYAGIEGVRLRGLMAMASNTDDNSRVRADFRKAAETFRIIKGLPGAETTLADFNVLSMGMSGDWPTAVEEGATMVRIGSAIFGERNYHS